MKNLAKFFLICALLWGGVVSAQTATFVKTDTTTTAAQGPSVYGIDGYAVALKISALPSYVSLTEPGASTYTWPSGTTCWYESPALAINPGMSGTTVHQIALYVVDGDNQGRSEKVTVLGGGNVLATVTVSSFSGGEYVVFNVSGAVTIQIQQVSGPNVVATGIYFSTPGTSVPPPSGPPTGPTGLNGDLAVILQWTASVTPGVTSNNIYRSTSVTGPFTVIGTTNLEGSTEQAFVDFTVSSGGTYWYQITAVANGAESAPTPATSVVVP